DLYGAAVAKLVRLAIISIPLVAIAILATGGFARITPTGFLPEDDQGAFFVVVQLPDGASVGRSLDVVKQVETVLSKEPTVADYTSVIGLNFLDNYSQPNAAFLILSLKSFEERKAPQDGASAIIALGTGGGFSYVLEDLRGGDPKAMAQVMRGLIVAANQDPKLSRVFSTFSATAPSLFLDIDRDKVQVLGVSLNSLFQALQASLGGAYVNDMNIFGRTWQVQVQAEAEDRASVDDIMRIYVRNDKGEMVPLRSMMERRLIQGPQALIRYNNKRAIVVTGSPAPGVSSGQAQAAMAEVAAKTLPQGFKGEWTDIAYQEQKVAGQITIVVGFALLFAYLFLVALYESWTIPVPVLLSVTVGVA